MRPISEAYNEDCMIGMARYPDKFFDLAVVDPEYRDQNQPDINMRKFGGMASWKGAPKAEYFRELQRVSKNQIIWGGNYFARFLEDNNNWIVWYKNNDGTHMSMAEMAWCSIRKNVKIFDMRARGENVDWHPTVKPIKLYDWLLKNYAQPFDKIIDTHMGSQSSRIAAFNMGFDYYGWEIDKDYFEAGNKRFLEQTAQLQIF